MKNDEIARPRAAVPSPEEDRDSPDAIARHAREATDKAASELRKQRVPIETEPPTVYRP